MFIAMVPIVGPRSDKKGVGRGNLVRGKEFFDLVVDDRDEPTYAIATVGSSDVASVVLLVSTRKEDLAPNAHALRREGHEVVEATSFEHARALLSSLRPKLLITSIQLGAYNGLHLVWQRHVEQPGGPSIVTSAYADTVLESEAARLGCPFLVAPVDPEQLLGVARSLLAGRAADGDDKRRWPRTRIGPEVPLNLDQGPATIVDVSYGGCRLRFQHGADVPFASSLSLPIPTSDVPILGTPIWRDTAHDGDVLGVEVAEPHDAEGAWRSFCQRADKPRLSHPAAQFVDLSATAGRWILPART